MQRSFRLKRFGKFFKPANQHTTTISIRLSWSFASMRTSSSTENWSKFRFFERHLYSQECFSYFRSVFPSNIVVHQSTRAKERETAGRAEHAADHMLRCFLQPMPHRVLEFLIPNHHSWSSQFIFVPNIVDYFLATVLWQTKQCFQTRVFPSDFHKLLMKWPRATSVRLSKGYLFCKCQVFSVLSCRIIQKF